MNLEARIQAFVNLGKHLATLPQDTLDTLTDSARQENPWFTPDSVLKALEGIASMLHEENLRAWASRYTLADIQPKQVGIVMAGNIPLVGFHDLLCVLICGHHALVKVSSKDSRLIRYVLQFLTAQSAAGIHAEIVDQLKSIDAVLATGSDNTSRYFEFYFSKYPNIIRKNRSSCAILTGQESPEELQKLGDDIFSYFGLGCRNVSKLYVPVGYNFIPLLESWNAYAGIIHHHKYCNNYDYQKSILLVNKIPFLDNGFVLLQESDKLVSPISVLFYEYYQDSDELTQKLDAVRDKIQCTVGASKPATIPFGQAQRPAVWDYADAIDTMKFLSTEV